MVFEGILYTVEMIGVLTSSMAEERRELLQASRIFLADLVPKLPFETVRKPRHRRQARLFHSNFLAFLSDFGSQPRLYLIRSTASYRPLKGERRFHIPIDGHLRLPHRFDVAIGPDLTRR